VIIEVNICQCCHAVFQTVSTVGEYTTMQGATSFFPSNSDLLPFRILMKDPNPYNLTHHICVNILLMTVCIPSSENASHRQKAYKHILVKKSQYDQSSFHKLKIRLRIHTKLILAHYASCARTARYQ